MSFRGPEGNSRREPITTAVRMQTAYLMQDPTSGVWGFTTNVREAEAAFTEDAASGVLGVDTSTTTHEAGMSVLIRGSATVVPITTS